MIGKPEWFARRKYGGWGICPKTWQGWVYVIIFIAIIFGAQQISFIDYNQLMVITFLIAVIFIVDTIDIMRKLKRDEREKIHEAIAERNALWAMITVLTIGIGYQSAVSVVKQTFQVDWVILVALFSALIVKAISNIYLDKKN